MRIKYDTKVVYYDDVPCCNQKYYIFESVRNFIHIRSDRKYGEYKWWYINGQIQLHCYYKDNKQDGKYISYDMDGNIKRHYYYKNDKIVKEIK